MKYYLIKAKQNIEKYSEIVDTNLTFIWIIIKRTNEPENYLVFGFNLDLITNLDKN